MVFDFLGIRVILVLITSFLAGVIDYRTGYIYDFITYPAIFLGFLIGLFEFGFSITMLKVVAIVGVVFVIGYFLYNLGKVGGGDIKLFIALGLLLPFYHQSIFIIEIVFWSAVISLIVLPLYYLTVLFAKRFGRKKTTGLWQLGQKLKSREFLPLFFLWVLFFILFILSPKTTGFFIFKILFLFVILVLTSFFLLFRKEINKSFFLKTIPITKLDEEEILAIEFFPKKIRKKLLEKLDGRLVLSKKDTKIFQSIKIKKIYVYRNLPRFGVFVLLGVVVSLLIPNLFEMLLFL